MDYLLLLAVVPSIFLFAFVYKNDRVEKEPFRLLLLLFIAGATLSVGFVKVFGGFIKLNILTKFQDNTLSYFLVRYFLSVGFVEELSKFISLYLITNKNKNFNSLYDGMLYSACVAIGFATIENIMYVNKYDNIKVVILRAILSVPCHYFYGIIMGYYYSTYHIYKKARMQEMEYAEQGLITVKHKFAYKTELYFAIVIPVLLHGFYDFCMAYGNRWLVIINVLVVSILYVYCFERVKKLSKLDRIDNQYVSAMLVKKYPKLNSIIKLKDEKEAFKEFVEDLVE